ncbi:MAG: VWA domain-containing protein [Desulfobulbaceae bacterium]|jgi:Ca-activated chloride channel family protein|nr:VWA domain-containing protein [Desulfobulbaceae bacterium]
MTLAHPWFLCGLLIIPILVLLYFRGRRNRPAIGYSDLSALRISGQSWRQHFIHLPFLLLIAGLILLIIGLARPQEGIEKMEEISHGIGIEIVVDRSSSMGEVLSYEGQRMNRLEAVKIAFNRFVFGDNRKLSGRTNDLIGIIAYAGFAETICPLTLAHDTLGGFIGQIKLANRNDQFDDGTAIGDALGLAAARLHEAGKSDEETGYELKSKIIILLTDGMQTAGQYTPMQGARLAKEWGIKVYTVYIGDKPETGGFFRRGNRGPEAVRTLQNIAAETGGLFWQANGGENLADVTAAIDQLEKSEIESIRYMDYNEFFHYFILAGLGCIGFGLLLKWTMLGVLA